MSDVTLDTIRKLVISIGLLSTLTIYHHRAEAQTPCERAKDLYHQATKIKHDIEQRIKVLQQSLKYCESFHSRYALGKAYLKKTDYVNAMDAFEQALANSGDDKNRQAIALARIAQVHYQQRQYASAKNTIKKVLKIHNTFKLKGKNQKLIVSIAQPIELAFSTQTVSAEQIKQVLSTKNYSVEQRVPVRVGFEFDSDQLTPQGREQVEEMAKAIHDLPLDQKIILIGHTDKRGEAQYNLKLSKKRAKRVYDYLLSEIPNAIYRLCYEGQGEQQPIIHKASDEQQHALNRRVEIQFISSCARRS